MLVRACVGLAIWITANASVPVPVDAQALIWAQQYYGPSGDALYGLDVDTQGDIVVTGHFSQVIDFGGGPVYGFSQPDVFLAKLDANSNEIWAQGFGDLDYQYSQDVATNPNQRIALTGKYWGSIDFGGGVLTSAGAADIYLAAFNPNGTHRWSLRFGTSNFEEPTGVAASLSGVALAAQIRDSLDFGGGPLPSTGIKDAVVAKYDWNGNHLWSLSFGNTGLTSIWDIAIDGDDNVLVCGGFGGTVDFGGGPVTSAGGDGYVVKYNAAGQHVWSKAIGGTGAQTSAFRLAVDHDDGFALTGQFEGSVDFGGGVLTSRVRESDMYLAKYTSDGTHVWSQRFGGPSSAETSLDMDVSATGEIVVGGSFWNFAYLGGLGHIASGGTDVFFARYAADGTYLWSFAAGDDANQSASRVSYLANGDFVGGGRFLGEIDLGNGPLVANWEDAFLARYQPVAAAVGSMSSAATCLRAWPIPSADAIDISFDSRKEPNPVLEIYDVRGRLVRRLGARTRQGQPSFAKWDGRDARGAPVAAGSYFVKLHAHSWTQARRVVLVR